MNLTQSERFHAVIIQGPESGTMRSLALELAHDNDLREMWFDFLIEQFLADQLSEEWIRVLEEIPDYADRIAFQSEIYDGIRTLHEIELREEIRSYLPRYKIDIKPISHRRVRIRRLGIAAAIVAILVTCVIWLQKPAGISADTAETKTVAIIPFDLIGVSEEMIVSGIAQRVPAKLAAINDVNPVSYSSVRSAMSRVKTKHPGKVLNASYVVSGTISRSGQDFQIQAELNDILNERKIWNATFTVDDNAKDIDDMQDTLAIRIAETLSRFLAQPALDRLSRDVTRNEAAMEYFLAGERLLLERTEDSIRMAIDTFSKALVLDPGAVIIRGYLALAYDLLISNQFAGDTLWQTALNEADKVLERDPDNPEALIVHGQYAQLIDKDYDKAAEYLYKALDLYPGDARIHQAIAELQMRTGLFELGLPHIQSARMLEPEHAAIRWVETKYLTAMGRLEVARIAANELMEMYPDYPNIKNFDWEYYLSKGEYNKALETILPGIGTVSGQYFRAMVFLEKNDYEALFELIPELNDDNYVFEDSAYESLRFLLFTQQDKWQQAYDLMTALLESDQFDLLARLQTADFRMFDKVKRDPGVKAILARYGITAHIVPHDEMDI